MPTLDEILAHKRLEVEALKARLRRSGSTTVMRAMGHVRSLVQMLKSEPFVIIPELKKADPWRGTFSETFDAVELAAALEQSGARALAVQTDTRYFKCSVDDLYHVSRRTKIPIIARDFVVDQAQLTEAKAKGADVVVLMASLLGEQVAQFVEFAQYILLETIVEVATEAEVELAVAARAKMIGVQNRDLRSQEVKLDRSITLRKRIPPDILAISVGAVSDPADIAPLQQAGYRAVVVGELLMRADDPAQTFAGLQTPVA